MNNRYVRCVSRDCDSSHSSSQTHLLMGPPRSDSDIHGQMVMTINVTLRGLCVYLDDRGLGASDGERAECKPMDLFKVLLRY